MYFFTDIDNLESQTDSFFGPNGFIDVNGISNDSFQVTNVFSSTTSAFAYSVTKGQIFVQRQATNPSLLNIVLKPVSDLGIFFPKIKYFIYKGIQESSLISGDFIAPKGTNDLTNSIWESNEINENEDSPSIGVLGLTSFINSISDVAELDLLYEGTYETYEPWLVESGARIGEFDSNNIGFEVILESVIHKPTLEDVRSSVNFILVPPLTNTLTIGESTINRHKREKCLIYLDPCSLYSSFLIEGKLFYNNNGKRDRIRTNQVYDLILSKFNNSEKTYIEIKNSFGFSVGHLKSNINQNSYGIVLKLSDLNGSTELNLEYYRSLWPLLIVDSSEIESITSNGEMNIQVSFYDDIGVNVFILRSIKKKLFTNRFLSSQERFQKLNVENNLTDSILVGLPTNSDDKVICSHFIMELNDDAVETSFTGLLLKRDEILDFIFPMSMGFEDSFGKKISTKVYNIQTFSENLDKYRAVNNIAFSYDESNISLMFFPNEYDLSVGNSVATLDIVDSDNNGVSIVKVLSDQYSNLRFGQEFIDEQNTFLSLNDPNLGLKIGTNLPTLDHIESIIVSREQWEDILSVSRNASNFIQELPIYVTIGNKAIFQTDYLSYDILLKGFQASTAGLKINEINTNVKCFSNGNF